jgi:UDP-GlcNAc:undecaprenyl-phosphate/decaprenyl-phosphate GlcNAc-1-phosphate transferase
VSAAAALVAYPVAALVLFALLRSSMARRFVAAPSEDRWHKHATPHFGGIGIFAGLAAGILAAVAVGAFGDANQEVLGILAGCTLIFFAGLLDDIFGLPPLAKLAAQLGAAAIVLSTGLQITSVTNHYLAVALATLWLVGMTNAFNLLDNMDGLAAVLAAIAALFFAIDAATLHKNTTVLVVSLALFNACLAFLPFNLRREGRASIFMGDSGSQVLGFTLACCGIAATAALEVAQTTVATLLLPLLILAVPIFDTTLVTVIRLFEGRPLSQGGRDHSSHRLVYHGLSDRRAVILLAAISAALGATSLTYSVIDNKAVTVIGVLLTFAFIVQFASFLADVDRSRDARPEPHQGRFRSVIIHRRRFVEVVVDGIIIVTAFYGAYVLRIGSDGTATQRSFLIATLPVLLFARYLVFIPMGLYRGLWRYADARDATRVAVAVAISELIAFGFMSASRVRGDFPRAIFVIDAVLCYLLIVGSRFWERAAYRGVSTLRTAGSRRRALVVGAGRSGRSFARELRETPGVQLVGWVDDDPRLVRHRLLGAPIFGTIDEMAEIVADARPDVVYVAIPHAPGERLDVVTTACHEYEIECQLVRRELEPVLPVTEPDELTNVTPIRRRGAR